MGHAKILDFILKRGVDLPVKVPFVTIARKVEKRYNTPAHYCVARLLKDNDAMHACLTVLLKHTPELMWAEGDHGIPLVFHVVSNPRVLMKASFWDEKTMSETLLSANFHQKLRTQLITLSKNSCFEPSASEERKFETNSKGLNALMKVKVEIDAAKVALTEARLHPKKYSKVELMLREVEYNRLAAKFNATRLEDYLPPNASGSTASP